MRTRTQRSDSPLSAGIPRAASSSASAFCTLGSVRTSGECRRAPGVSLAPGRRAARGSLPEPVVARALPRRAPPLLHCGAMHAPERLPDWEAFYRDYRKPGYVAGFEISSKLGGGMFGL